MTHTKRAFVDYCNAPTEEQERLLLEWGVHTAYDLVEVVRAFTVAAGAENPSAENAVFRQQLCRFLRYRCARVVVHFDALFGDRVLVKGGEYPKQWVSATPDKPAIRDSLKEGRATERRAPKEEGRLPFDSELAFPALPRGTRRPPFDAAVARPAPRSCLDVPYDLCCPLTLELFVDPVVASSGNTYERSAIEEWLQKEARDPLSNLPLSTTSLVSDASKKRACEAYRKGGVAPAEGYSLFGRSSRPT